MKITNNYSYNPNIISTKPNAEQTDRKSNFAMGALAYATFMAIFPHNEEKLGKNLSAGFNALSVKDKIKNTSKAALQFFGYPALALAGLCGFAIIADKYEKKHPHKATKFEEFMSKNNKKIKKIEEIAFAPTIASLSYMAMKREYKNVKKSKLIAISALFASTLTALMTCMDGTIKLFDKNQK